MNRSDTKFRSTETRLGVALMASLASEDSEGMDGSLHDQCERLAVTMGAVRRGQLQRVRPSGSLLSRSGIPAGVYTSTGEDADGNSQCHDQQ